jgi:hypothetical protein
VTRVRATSLQPLAAFICFLALQVGLDAFLRARTYVPVVAPPERGTRWDPEVFSILSFGQLPSAVDSVWINVLLDDRLAKVPRWAHAKIYYDLDLITHLDPAFCEAYHAGANLLAIVRDDVVGAKDLITRADLYRKQVLPLQSQRFQQWFWPYPWSIPLLGGYIGLFEEGSLPEAAYFFKEAAEIPGSPEYLQSMEKRFNQPGGEYQVGLRLLNYMIQTAPSLAAKEELVLKRNSLMVGEYLYDMNRAFKDYLGQDRKYRTQSSLTPTQMQKYWRDFIKSSRSPERDPWGGRLSIDASGRVGTTTPHQKVFGLDGEA